MENSLIAEILRLSLKDLNTPASASITDVQHLASYNWIDRVGFLRGCAYDPPTKSTRSCSSSKRRSLARKRVFSALLIH
ncbi:hypothetical protein BKA66DRAFT_476738 [Pyrenochaeta sp. MPI-SDFR-AT-0127]|nr:hypothetical protein BKA66DRAFT_476738 [Pyrenochaeta sp. MPI-SDFR-AT-0127]